MVFAIGRVAQFVRSLKVLFKIGGGSLKTATQRAKEGLKVIDMLTSVCRGYALSAGVELGIFDVVTQNRAAMTANEVATELGLDTQRTERLLRVLASSGLVVERGPYPFKGDGTMRFGANEATRLMSRHDDGALRLRDLVRLELGPQHGSAHLQLKDLLASTRETGIERVFGVDFSALLQDDKDYRERFNGAMTQVSELENPALVSTILKDRVLQKKHHAHVVDIAGGHGKFLCLLLEMHPWMTGSVHELRAVVDSAQHCGTERMGFVKGDMFDSATIPAGDVYCLKHILHDWEDDAAMRILRSIREAAPRGSKVIIAEQLMPESANRSSSYAFGFDVSMMTGVGGRERTARAYKELLEKCGFHWMGVCRNNFPIKALVATC